MTRRTPISTLFPYTTLFRSLYMPGLNERALEKAKTLPADALILDLEDSVAPESKIAARDNVCEARSEEHTSELQSQSNLVCRLLLEKKNKNKIKNPTITNIQ